ncbi:DUF6069 family protein [Actinosynnema sp. NPDC047251]|uniref:Putative membrane protein n=1 Tax=Saccharothrix espanaensis (strain ATCC 51144 / DSM 44229 / JCM 9112 / NBRC 15066 / NRRL 15764) TaxID=1179773 RepID=K0K043_SACES|nr:DUF6069 family protein [Saccharothrix espanaensis]CCH31686.1 putative membrane protein [Saccharothrix espanaensis DSM 44229]
MSSAAGSATTPGRPTRNQPRGATTTTTDVRPIWLVGALAGLAGAAAAEVYGLPARLVGVPMAAGGAGAAAAEPITVGMFAMGTLICTFWGTLPAVALGRWARRDPARTWTWVTVALTAVSMAGPLTAGATAWSTKVMLLGSHIVAAAVVIPLVARRLRTTRRPVPGTAQSPA